MIGETISHYRIIEKIGSGGMGDVYKAEDEKLQRIVALKFLPLELTRDEGARQRFLREARTVSALDHPNIGIIHEINEDDGHFFIAFAYYEGETLAERIERGPLDIGEALDIAVQIAEGLSKAHSQDIVHRDIKPSNVIITDEGQVKVIDFGIAKLRGKSKLTETGMTMGTVEYMSPEQTMGQTVDQRTDIWSLGVMLYEMLAGEQPFQGETLHAVISSILSEEPEFITKIRGEVPQRVEKILEKALAKKIEKRFQTMEEMLVQLKTAVEELEEGQASYAPLFKLRRKQLKYAYRASIVVIAAIALGVFFWQREVAQAAPISVALLPLESITSDAEQEWFTDGMTDALITDLAKISGLRVISRSTAMKYKGTDKVPPEIAAELGVEYVIEGSVVKMDEQIKVSVRLINAPNDEYLWAEQYEREFSDILMLQGEIAQTIANQIQVTLTPQEEQLLTVSRSVNPETHELYLKGMYHLNKFTPQGIEKGMNYLHEAVEKDPEEPLAHAGLALGYDILAHTPSPPPDAIPMGRAAALRALELDDTLAEVHLALAMIKVYADWDREGGRQSYQRALELNPSLALAHAHYAWALLIEGQVDEALEELYRAQELDPLEPIYPSWQAGVFNWNGDHDQALEEALKAVELVPDFPVGLANLADVYEGKGMYEEAIAVRQKASEISPAYKWGLGHTYALAGQRDEALQVAAELESQPDAWNTWGLAEIYTALGEEDKAFRWLEAAYEQRHPYIQWLRRNINFKPLRDDPRYEDLAQRLDLPE